MKLQPVNLLLILLCILGTNSQPVPLNVNLSDNSNSNLNFSLNLPNNDTVQIGLSFRLLTYTAAKKNTNSESTDSTTVYEVTTNVPERKFVSVEEAIEGFRQELIKKEMEIAGIFESKDIFYRHFKLEFDEDKTITIRCSYDSNYSARTLKIFCYEYHEFETERILSNGEVEIIKQQDLDYNSNIEFLDLRKMKQTYHMNIA